MSIRLATFWATIAVAALSCAAPSPPGARLLGIVSLPGKSLAALEIAHPFYDYDLPYVLQAGDSVIDLTVSAIEPAKGAVTLRVNGTNAPVVLKLPELPGMREEPTLHLRSAPSDVLLELYQQISGRTMLRGAGLPNNRVDLISDPRLDVRQALAVLVAALSTNGIAVKPAGELFAFAVRPLKLDALDSIPAPPRPAGVQSSNVIPRNMLRFFKADLKQLLDLFGELADRTFVHADDFAQRHITVRNETPLTRADGVWLAGALVQLQGVAINNEGDNLAVVMPFSSTNRVARLAGKPLLRDEYAVPPRRLRLASGSAEQFLKLYCEIAAKRYGSVNPAAAHVRFECRSGKPLTRREAIYVLETVAALQDIVLVENAAGEVEMTMRGRQRVFDPQTR